MAMPCPYGLRNNPIRGGQRQDIAIWRELQRDLDLNYAAGAIENRSEAAWEISSTLFRRTWGHRCAPIGTAFADPASLFGQNKQ